MSPAQEDLVFHGLSGPEALAQRPLIVLIGIAAAGKLLWLAVGDQLRVVAREFGAAALGRLAAPLIAMAAICADSYDTSRIAEVGVATLLLAWSGCVRRWPPRAVAALAIGNLVLPSVYVSPYFERSLGVMWPPGLYSAYHGFRADTLSASQSAGAPIEDVGVQDGGSLAGKLSSDVVATGSGARGGTAAASPLHRPSTR